MLATMPWTDWQLWVTSLVAPGGLGVVAQPFVQRRKKSPEACPGCGNGACKPRPNLVSLGGAPPRNTPNDQR
mgnify:CR=1 FL=1